MRVKNNLAVEYSERGDHPMSYPRTQNDFISEIEGQCFRGYACGQTSMGRGFLAGQYFGISNIYLLHTSPLITIEFIT